MLQLFLKENEAEYSSKLEEKQKSFQINTSRLVDLENKMNRLSNHVEKLLQPQENTNLKDLLKKNPSQEEIPQYKQDQLNHDDDKAILKGDIINIAEHDCELCKKKFKNENNLKTHDV